MRNNRNYLGIWTNIAHHIDLKYDKNAVLGYITVAYNGKDDFFLEYFFYWIVGGLVQLVPDYPDDGIQKYQKKHGIVNFRFLELNVFSRIPVIDEFEIFYCTILPILEH